MRHNNKGSIAINAASVSIIKPSHRACVRFVGMISLLLLSGAWGFLIAPPRVSITPAEARIAADTAANTMSALPVFIILKAFASGCATLTGIEAVSNGVRAFRPPEAKNASATLATMALLLIAFTAGTAFLADFYGITPGGDETVLSKLAGRIFSHGALYYCLQLSTAMILVFAANTSFADFPRLSSIMSADRYLPRQFSSLGDRLVFSNGIVILGFFSILLIILFRGDTHALIPLYAVGVFTAFTLSQAGMVVHWIKAAGRKRP